MLLKFLETFANLRPAEQQVFLFCLKNNPFPRPYTGDIRQISRSTGLSRTTVYNSLLRISQTPRLRRLVCYIRTDVNELIKQEYQERMNEGAFNYMEEGEEMLEKELDPWGIQGNIPISPAEFPAVKRKCVDNQ